jgi:uncharacterized membrane protein YfcA
MKLTQIILLGGCLSVLVVDGLGSIASRRFNFNYARLVVLSFIVYTAVGFFGALEVNQTTAVILAAVVGFFDATIGWKTAMQLNANTGNLDNNPSLPKWILTAIFVTILAAVFGIIGAALSSLMR